MSRLMLRGVVSWLVLIPSAPLWADDTEEKAVAFVEKLRGRVTRDEKLRGKPVIRVHLSFSAVTDAGLKELAALENLTSLDLAGTQVTDTGLKELAPLKNLKKLLLSDTQVTDAGLTELAPLKNLTTLGLKGTRVTDAGVKELQKALPKCEIQPLADPRGRKAHLSWTRINAIDGNFRALFPVEPKRSKMEDPPGFEYRAAIPEEAVSFFITYTPNIATSVSLDARLTASQNSTKSSRNAQRRSVDICGFAGREMTHEYTYINHTVVSRHRIFYAGTDMYHLLVLAVDHKTFPEEDANHFFSGFELLNESKEKGTPP